MPTSSARALTLQKKLADVVSPFPLAADLIYSAPMGPVTDQSAERDLRERVAAQEYEDYLAAIAESHSIGVMDREVDRFLTFIPRGGLILDIGGCWGWHWRRIGQKRADVGVLIIDFVRSNLVHSRRVLGCLVGTQVALMHADATHLPFYNRERAHSAPGFDGVWSVQVFQHIPDFRRALAEAHRVLRKGGRFANFSLHRTPLNRAIYRLFGKSFHVEGMVADAYYLTRASDEQLDVLRGMFGAEVTDRYTECLFHPDLRLRRSAREGSLLGKVDAWLSHVPSVGRWIARQRSFEVTKP